MKAATAAVHGERAERLEELARRAHGARDDDLAAALVRDLARERGGDAVELAGAVLQAVQLQPEARSRRSCW